MADDIVNIILLSFSDMFATNEVEMLIQMNILDQLPCFREKEDNQVVIFIVNCLVWFHIW